MNSYSINELYIGLEESFSVRLDSTMMSNFAHITKDVNPLHVDKSYALSKGFENKVVYGLLTASFYSTLVGVHLPGKYCILHGIDVSFIKPVYEGDRLLVTGIVHCINDVFQRAEIKAHINNQDNVIVSKSMLKVGLLDV
jgi:3-hydroxybutyryl-CoA dehydratase